MLKNRCEISDGRWESAGAFENLVIRNLVFGDLYAIGIGIPDSIKSKLFKEVTSIRRTGLEGQNSIGLGLAVTKKLRNSITEALM